MQICQGFVSIALSLVFLSGCKTAERSQSLKSSSPKLGTETNVLICKMAAKKSKPYLVYQISLAGSKVTEVSYQAFPDAASDIPGKPGVLESFAGGDVDLRKSKVMISDAVDGDAGFINLYSKNNGVTGRITFTNSAPEGLEGDGRGYNLICETGVDAVVAKVESEGDGDLSKSEQVDFNLQCQQSTKSWSQAVKRNKAAVDDITNRQFIRMKISGKSDAPGLRGSKLLELSYSHVNDPKETSNFMELSGFDPAQTASYSSAKNELYIESMADGDAGFMTLKKNSSGVWKGYMNFPNGSAKGWFYGEEETIGFDCKN